MNHTRLIEVHGNDGTSHVVSAKHAAERIEPGCTVLNVQASGQRCDHGFIVWSVEIDGPATGDTEGIVEAEPDLHVHYTSVNEDGEVYGHHENVTDAIAMLHRFPNDTVVITLGEPYTPPED